MHLDHFASPNLNTFALAQPPLFFYYFLSFLHKITWDKMIEWSQIMLITKNEQTDQVVNHMIRNTN